MCAGVLRKRLQDPGLVCRSRAPQRCRQNADSWIKPAAVAKPPSPVALCVSAAFSWLHVSCLCVVAAETMEKLLKREKEVSTLTCQVEALQSQLAGKMSETCPGVAADLFHLFSFDFVQTLTPSHAHSTVFPVTALKQAEVCLWLNHFSSSVA